jgi:hypothetical protein
VGHGAVLEAAGAGEVTAFGVLVPAQVRVDPVLGWLLQTPIVLGRWMLPSSPGAHVPPVFFVVMILLLCTAAGMP